MGFAIFLAVVAILAFYAAGVYNGLARVRDDTRRTWSDIDALLVARHDELPRLVESCRRHMHYEHETLERVMKARAAVFQAAGRSDVAAVGAAESMLRSGLGQLVAAVENYPQLKSDSSFHELWNRIAALEDDIAEQREHYNAAVSLNNVRIQQFPGSAVARLFRFTDAAPLEFTDDRRRGPGSQPPAT
jgi:LemA protein